MKISAVIPCFGEQKKLDRTIECLQNQTMSLHEIIVVDDGSIEPVTVPENVRLVRIDRSPSFRGSSKAKNIGAEAASGDWLLFSDNDILHLPDAVECIARLARLDTLLNVFSLPVTEQDDVTDLQRLMDTMRMEGRTLSGVLVGEHASTEQHCGLINRAFFRSLGGYDSETFKSWGLNNQDLCLRVLKSGGAVSSRVTRDDGTLLYCFHQYSAEPRDSVTAKREFKEKYGRDFHPAMLQQEALSA